jgi:hypothetical protein
VALKDALDKNTAATREAIGSDKTLSGFMGFFTLITAFFGGSQLLLAFADSTQPPLVKQVILFSSMGFVIFAVGWAALLSRQRKQK